MPTKPLDKGGLYFEELGSCFEDWISKYDVERRANLIKIFLSTIDISGRTCLEVGCGTGKISEAINHLFDQYVASDISEKLARGVGERLGLDWMQLDACNMDITTGTYDVVISSECIEHTGNPQKALSEMARILKARGTIIVTSPNRLWYPVLWASIAARIRKFHGSEKWLFPWKAASILRACGITDIRISGCHLFPWQAPFARHVLPSFDKFGRFLYFAMVNYVIYGRKSENYFHTEENKNGQITIGKSVNSDTSF